MRAVIQRVVSASVKNRETGAVVSIGRGIVVLAGFEKNDTEDKTLYAAEKISSLRLFPSAEVNKDFSVSVKDAGYEILLIPQFTLYGDIRKGRRPDFNRAMAGPEASRLFEKLKKEFSSLTDCAFGWFGVSQEVKIVNDGPVTLILDK